MAHHQGDIALMMKDIENYNKCKGCKTDGHRYIEFLVGSSNEIAMTVVTAGVVHVIRGAKAAHYLNTLRKVTQNEKAVTFTINGVANATIGAIFDESQRSVGNFTYNVIVGGTAGNVASRMPTAKKNMAAQGVVYGSGELAKHTFYGTNEVPPSTGDVLLKTGIATSGGVLGGIIGNKTTRTTNTYFPNASKTTKTTVDAVSGSITSSSFGYLLQSNPTQDYKSVTITAAGTAEYGVEGFVGVSASNKSRLDGFFSEVCSSGGGAVVVGVCAGANLERNQPLIVTGKVGTRAGAFAGANVGYQWTVNLPESKDDHK
ncbi:hypothetical protein [Neisseria weixii]|uniref:hypothetical protein n=1 Tax=Neisseria weixii TaxID=1853276 RepID=UPI001F1E0D6A|nr:hypothetical protein [Neisseria weixii]